MQMLKLRNYKIFLKFHVYNASIIKMVKKSEYKILYLFIMQLIICSLLKKTQLKSGNKLAIMDNFHLIFMLILVQVLQQSNCYETRN